MPRAAAPLVPALVALLAAPWPQAWLVVVGSVAAAAAAAVWRHGVAIPDARLVLMTMMLSWLAIGTAFVAETMPLAASLALVAALVVVLTLMLGPGTPAQPSVGPGLIGVVLGSTAVAAGAARTSVTLVLALLAAGLTSTAAATRRTGAALARRLRSHSPERVVTRLSGPVCVYFGEDLERFYQIEQWLPVLEILDASVPVSVLTRDQEVHARLRSGTALPCAFAATGADVIGTYAHSVDLVVLLYVNNGTLNFQSLAWTGATHVHLGHGESDKASSVSHQFAAYDVVMVAGQAALDRLRRTLGDSCPARLMEVGRPQLDRPFGDVLPQTTRRTFVYAPTWQGEDEANNYTSLDVMGEQIVGELLAMPDARVVYSPHPRVTTARGPVLAAHRAVEAAIRNAIARAPEAGHVVWTDDVLDVLPRADVLVADVSSVPVDHLFLRPEATLVLTDRRGDRAGLAAVTPLAEAAVVVDRSTVVRLRPLLAEVAAGLGLRRLRLRDYYFAATGDGESTSAFVTQVSRLVHAPQDSADSGDEVVSD